MSCEGMQCDGASGAPTTAVSGLTALSGRKRRAADSGHVSNGVLFDTSGAPRPVAKRAMRSSQHPVVVAEPMRAPAGTCDGIAALHPEAASAWDDLEQQKQQQQIAAPPFAAATPVPPALNSLPLAAGLSANATSSSIQPIPVCNSQCSPEATSDDGGDDDIIEEIDATAPLPPIWRADTKGPALGSVSSSSSGRANTPWGPQPNGCQGPLVSFGPCGALSPGTLVRTSSSSCSDEERQEWQVRALLAALRRAGLLPPDQARQLEASPGAIAAMLRSPGAGERLRGLTASLTPQQQAALWHAWREVSAMAGGAPMLLAAPVAGMTAGGGNNTPSCVVSEESSSSSDDNAGDGGDAAVGNALLEPLGGDEDMAIDPQNPSPAAPAVAPAAAAPVAPAVSPAVAPPAAAAVGPMHQMGLGLPPTAAIAPPSVAVPTPGFAAAWTQPSIRDDVGGGEDAMALD